ncbi:hypothetical protein CDAR_222171 [Caerostris darwini]|uniref:Uncharacterized protein n=1 Tax=Caerostris darwini TaxID=1538125 RepID=A0AAV4P508_9ARAC|nr:hypothetical protein CDAR_222171 [Caerostris darwini]
MVPCSRGTHPRSAVTSAAATFRKESPAVFERQAAPLFETRSSFHFQTDSFHLSVPDSPNGIQIRLIPLSRKQIPSRSSLSPSANF